MHKHYGNKSYFSLAASASEDRTPLLASQAQYDAMYKRSIEDPEGFWGEQAQGYYWHEQVSLTHL